MALPLINGTAYSYADVVFKILGVDINSTTEIEYETTQEKVNNYGAGEFPVSRGKGTKEVTASITFSMNDAVALRDSIPSKDLTDIPPFDLMVIYRHPDRTVTDVLKNCEFTKDGSGMALGDTDVLTTFDLMPSHIERDN